MRVQATWYVMPQQPVNRDMNSSFTIPSYEVVNALEFLIWSSYRLESRHVVC
jgi:hypothetical protein